MRYLPLILFFILPLLAFPELIFGQQTLYETDLTWIHYPRHIFAANEWLAGRVPLWDPYEDTGIPLLAETQVGALYPLSVIFLSPLSPSLELSLFAMLHFSLAAMFTAMLAKSLGLSQSSATLAGLSYGFGGFLMGQLPNLNIMTGAVWLPLILLAIRQALMRRTLLAAMLAGLPIALQILTAQPQMVFYSLVTVISYGLYQMWKFSREDAEAQRLYLGMGINQPVHAGSSRNLFFPLMTLALLLVAILTGLFLTAPQLLPTYELQQHSVRDSARGFNFLTNTSWPPHMALNLILPSAFGNNVLGFKGGDPFQEVFIYIGFIPLMLVPFSWQRRHQPDVPFFMLMLLGSLLLALGSYTWLYEYLIQYLPVFSLFRIPARWLMGVNLALAILAGFGLETIRQHGVSRRAWLALVSLTSLLGILLIGMWMFQAQLQSMLDPLPEFEQRLARIFLERGFTPQPIYQERLLLRWFLPLTAPAWLMLTNLLVVMILFTMYHYRRLNTQNFSTMLILAVSIDLVLAGGTTINPLKPVDWWHHLSGGAEYVLEHVDGYRVFPLGMGSETATVSHLGQYFPSVYQVRSSGGHGSSLRNSRYAKFLKEADPVQALQLVGARYMLTLGQMGADVAATYPAVYQADDGMVYHNQHPLPRAFIVHQAIVADTPDEALSHFQIRSVNPADTVVLENEPNQNAQVLDLTGDALASGNLSGLANSGHDHEQATISNENPQQIEIQVSLSQDGYLVLLDSFYPGWQATVNGQPSPIYRANYINRAVFVPAGEHVVQFRYRPWSFRLGLILAGLTWLILVGLAFQQRKPRHVAHASACAAQSKDCVTILSVAR
ncbi:YfhO family protein [Anaerolineales bacterium HSG24]|nr:YfhO family protein [Anaerolineales bacterium HSG24]